ncbi:MAG: 50S ribosomal protein L4, partial [Thermoleophilaceae bacterium]|nr:50S ribosomal protein L4 [Thermoleophilaceae bacterium]
GGVTFGPKPRSYTFKINRKARRKALRIVLSLHAQRGTIAIIEADTFKVPSTSTAANALTKWQADGSVVLLTAGDVERDCALSFRNIGRVRAVLPPDQFGVAEIAMAQNLVISKQALEELAAHTALEVPRGDGPNPEVFDVRPRVKQVKGVKSKPREVAAVAAPAPAEEAAPAAVEAEAPSEQGTEDAS